MSFIKIWASISRLICKYPQIRTPTAKCTDFSSRDRRGSLESKFHSLIRLNLSIRCQLNPPITETGIYVVFFNKFRLDFSVKKDVVSYT